MEISSWIDQWARRAGGSYSAVVEGWELLLPCGRSINVSSRDEQFLARGPLPKEICSWSPVSLLRWQFSNPVVISLATSPGQPLQLQMGAALPLEGIALRHVSVLLDSVAAYSTATDEERIREEEKIRV